MGPTLARRRFKAQGRVELQRIILGKAWLRREESSIAVRGI